MKVRNLIIGILLVLLILPGSLLAQSETGSAETGPVVQAVLFYSPTCPHCHQVINNDLPPLQEQYGDQLQILGVDTSKPGGQELYQNAVERFKISQNRLGVPLLIVGEVTMVGSQEIPQQFPQLIADGMAAGGVGWPDIPQLREVVPNLPPTADPDAVAETAVQPVAEAETAETAVDSVSAAPESPAVEAAAADTAVEEAPAAADLGEIRADAITAEVTVPPPDPVGFALAWLIMIGMVVALAFVLMRFRMVQPHLPQILAEKVNTPVTLWAVPVLVLIGLVVASYLAYVEVQHVAAVCGPIGECNIVQASPYARIFGIPVAVLGLINYVVVGGLWLWQLAGSRRQIVNFGLVGLTIFGTLFSIYLTAVELFAIHAVCAWCLTSAVVTTLLMVVVVSAATTRPGSEPPDVQMGTD